MPSPHPHWQPARLDMPASEREVLRLQLESVVHVAGEDLRGEVHLDFRALQRTPIEEVTVTFHGRLQTYVTETAWCRCPLTKDLLLSSKATYTANRETHTSRSKIDLINETNSLWTKGAAYPPPGEHVLKLPFCFTLPSWLKPSCEFSHSKKGSIAYAVRVVGRRTGLHFNKTIVRPLPVLPYHEKGALLRDTLLKEGFGTTRSQSWEKKIRRGIWGEYSTVEVSVRHFLPLTTVNSDGVVQHVAHPS